MTNFTPGPSQLYFTVNDHVKNALRSNVGSLSHRSAAFEKMYIEATSGLKELLNIPSSHSIFFTSSATEIWERSIQNLVGEKCFHFVNGAFSKRYFEIATQLNKSVSKIEVNDGLFFNSKVEIPTDTELIAVTHNETSTGVSWPLADIYKLKDENPDALMVVDAVSSMPYPAFDFTKIDSLFFSVQKGFGLPAGLGVWIVNDRCLAKADNLLSKGISIGSYHNLPTLYSFAKKNQTPETPNVLGIYLFSKIIADFTRRGIENIRNETNYKAAVLYQAIQSHEELMPFVSEVAYQSKTVIVANCGEKTTALAQVLQSKNLFPGDGYGKEKATQLRFANFPAHSKEQYELLADTITAF